MLAWRDRLVAGLGNERHILTEANEAEIAELATMQLARAIVAQRTAPAGRASKPRNEGGGGSRQLNLLEGI